MMASMSHDGRYSGLLIITKKSFTFFALNGVSLVSHLTLNRVFTFGNSFKANERERTRRREERKITIQNVWFCLHTGVKLFKARDDNGKF